MQDNQLISLFRGETGSYGGLEIKGKAYEE